MSTKDIFIEILEGRIRDLNEAGKALVGAIERYARHSERTTEQDRGIQKATEMMDYKEKYEAIMSGIDAAILCARDEKTKISLENIKLRNAESEDERIRREILDYIKVNYRWSKKEELEQRRRFIAYLEKQKERKQKPAEWSEEDEHKISSILYLLHSIDNYNFDSWLKSLRPSWKPSEGLVWRIWQNGACGNSDGNPIALVKTYGGYELVSCLGAGGEKYIMLSDLEKLPSFNEE